MIFPLHSHQTSLLEKCIVENKFSPLNILSFLTDLIKIFEEIATEYFQVRNFNEKK